MKLPAAFSAFSVVATLSLTLALTTDAPAASALPKSSVVYSSGDPATATKLTDAQLETLLGPVALYPDALIALILPASASSSDIVLAARYLAANQDPQQLDAQAWDESVRSLARYPDVIKWLDENLAWTQQLGTAFLAQPAEVMQAVQRLRARARAAGTLIDTPQQKVITEGEVILIEPASPTVIYVPRYDPEVVYVSRPYGWTQPSLFFGLGFGVGSWLSYDCDWRTRTIVVGDWRRRPQTVWVRPAFPHRPPAPGVTVVVGRPWQPPAHRHPRSTVIVNDPRRPVVIVNPRPYYEHPRRPGSDDPRRHESGPRSRSETRPTTTTVIVNAPPTLSPPPVVMPPAHTIGGPPVDLPERQVVPLGLVLHELATNAGKYGAWLPPGGEIAVSWTCTDRHLRLEWAEFHDHAAPQPAGEGRRGFGSSLIDGSARQLGGTIERRFGPQGIAVLIEFPLAE